MCLNKCASGAGDGEGHHNSKNSNEDGSSSPEGMVFQFVGTNTSVQGSGVRIFEVAAREIYFVKGYANFTGDRRGDVLVRRGLRDCQRPICLRACV